MKQFLMALAIVILFATPALADNIQFYLPAKGTVEVKSVCIEGYLFVVVSAFDNKTGSVSVSIEQVFGQRNNLNGDPTPVKCSK